MKRTLIAGATLSLGALAVLLVHSLPVDRVEVPLESRLPPRANGDSLTVFYIAHPTDSDPQAEVEEARDLVTITVTVDEGCSGTCTAEGIVGPITVTLSEPLASRTIEDGSKD